MLVGKEEDFFVAFKCPFECCRRVGGGAHQPAALATEGFDGGAGIHVGQRSDAAALIAGHAHADQLFPAAFYLADLRHIGHGAAGIEIGQDDLLAIVGQNVRALSHEMDTAENDVFGAGTRRFLRQFVRVAAKVGKPNDFVALIMVPQHHDASAQFTTGRGNPRVHTAVGKD